MKLVLQLFECSFPHALQLPLVVLLAGLDLLVLRPLLL
jgi:hypothetical protein